MVGSQNKPSGDAPETRTRHTSGVHIHAHARMRRCTCSSSYTHRWHCCPTQKPSGEGGEGQTMAVAADVKWWSEKATESYKRPRKTMQGNRMGWKATEGASRLLTEWSAATGTSYSHTDTLSPPAPGGNISNVMGGFSWRQEIWDLGRGLTPKYIYIFIVVLQIWVFLRQRTLIRFSAQVFMSVDHMYNTHQHNDPQAWLVDCRSPSFNSWLNHWVPFSSQTKCWACWTLLSIYTWHDLYIVHDWYNLGI